MAFIERTSCDACGETQRLTTVASLPFTTPLLSNNLTARYKNKITLADVHDTNYEIVSCDRCGFLYQKYIPDEELSNRLYSYEPSRITQSLNKKSAARLEYFMRHARIAEKALALRGNIPHKTTILDFGSGWGFFLRMAAAYGARVEGVEISTERRAFSEAAGIPVFTHIEDTAAFHDIIYSDQTFEHIPSPLTFLKQLSDRLSPDGIVYISTPDCRSTPGKLPRISTEIIPDLFPLEHINGFNNTSLVALAKRAGLEPIPPRTMCALLWKKGHLAIDGQFFQEALKAFYTQRASTSVWFRRSRSGT